MKLERKIQNDKYNNENSVTAKEKKCCKIYLKQIENKNNIAINLLKLFIIINILTSIFSYEIEITTRPLNKGNGYKIYNARAIGKRPNKVFLEDNEIGKGSLMNFNDNYYYDDNGYLVIYRNDESYVDTVKLTFNDLIENMAEMFKDCDIIISVNFNNFDISHIKSLSHTFHSCTSLQKINNKIKYNAIIFVTSRKDFSALICYYNYN